MTVLVNSYKQSHLGNLAIAYDGSKAVYTNRKLPFDVKDFMVTLADSRPASSRLAVLALSLAAVICVLLVLIPYLLLDILISLQERA